jgi:hypothetical protein
VIDLENMRADQSQLGSITSELDEPIWAVVSFEKAEAMNLTYEDASSKLAELDRQGIPGLCIVTNQAALNLDPEISNTV